VNAAAGASPPPLIATVGLHASASTWVFNVVRELMIAATGETHVMSCYADERAQVPEAAGRHLVIKSHRGSQDLDDWLAASGARVFLSVRDPRDACMSMAQRFRSPIVHTARWIADDCDRLMRLAAQGHPLLRYEDRFFDDRQAPKRIAVMLGLAPDPAVLDAIFNRYTTESVRAFARSLAALPSERLTTVVSFPMDRVTQILAPHIGDTQIGKWLDLPIHKQAELTRAFRAFLDQFGYPC
jgi:hypothetical protein